MNALKLVKIGKKLPLGMAGATSLFAGPAGLLVSIGLSIALDLAVDSVKKHLEKKLNGKKEN